MRPKTSRKNRTTVVIVDNNNQRGVTEVKPSEGARSGIGKENSMASHQGGKAMVVISVMAWGIE